MKYWKSVQSTFKNPLSWGVSLFFSIGVGAGGTWGNYGFLIAAAIWGMFMFIVFPSQTIKIWKEHDNFHKDKVKCPQCNGEGHIFKEVL